MEHRDEIDPYLAAYRAVEPRRRRSPFGDPRLARIAAERATRAATPWYRRLLLNHPAPAFASSALTLALLLAPAGSPMVAERSGAPVVMDDVLQIAASPLTTPDIAAVPETAGPELLPTLLAVAAVASALEGIRRLRAARG